MGGGAIACQVLALMKYEVVYLYLGKTSINRAIDGCLIDYEGDQRGPSLNPGLFVSPISSIDRYIVLR